jgi:hypothetical protein
MLNELPFFEIGVEAGGHIRVTSLHPEAKAYWADCKAEILGQGFSAVVLLDVDAIAFHNFYQDVNAMVTTLSGSAEYATPEEQIYINLELNRLGHVAVTGFLASSEETTKIAFNWRSDQPYLGPLRDHLSQLCEIHPFKDDC